MINFFSMTELVWMKLPRNYSHTIALPKLNSRGLQHLPLLKLIANCYANNWMPELLGGICLSLLLPQRVQTPPPLAAKCWKTCVLLVGVIRKDHCTQGEALAQAGVRKISSFVYCQIPDRMDQVVRCRTELSFVRCFVLAENKNSLCLAVEMTCLDIFRTEDSSTEKNLLPLDYSRRLQILDKEQNFFDDAKLRRGQW